MIGLQLFINYQCKYLKNEKDTKIKVVDLDYERNFQSNYLNFFPYMKYLKNICVLSDIIIADLIKNRRLLYSYERLRVLTCFHFNLPPN